MSEARDSLADTILKRGRPWLMELNHAGTAINLQNHAKVLTQQILQDCLDYAWATGFDACRIEKRLGKSRKKSLESQPGQK